jgi:DNA-binding MarR family transcriptional regulator
MPRFHRTIPVDDYVLDILMRDIVGHDQQPAAYLVYLYLYGRAVRSRWHPVKASLRLLADETGLSKSAVQAAIATLQFRELIATERDHATAVPSHSVLRHWRGARQRGGRSVK